ncbi:MAG: hypothetical protein FWH49_05905 [Clostridiales bacterium]|nr:hypothetical protein [Clostridiales bacterium]
MLSVKENFMRALRGEVPAYIPRYSIFWGMRPSFMNGDRVDGVGKDIFGVEWTKEGSAVDATLPKPGDFILEDIRQWRDVIKFPDFSGTDWEAVAKKDLENVDPELPRGGGASAVGFFQALYVLHGLHKRPDRLS